MNMLSKCCRIILSLLLLIQQVSTEGRLQAASRKSRDQRKFTDFIKQFKPEVEYDVIDDEILEVDIGENHQKEPEMEPNISPFWNDGVLEFDGHSIVANVPTSNDYVIDHRPHRDYVEMLDNVGQPYTNRQQRNNIYGPINAVVDLLIVVDHSIYRKALQRFGNNVAAAIDDIKNYYSMLTTLVDYRYLQLSDSSLSIRVRQSGIYIAQERTDSPWAELNVRQHNDGSEMVLDPNIGLQKFQEWLRDNSGSDWLPKFDHAMAFTGYSLLTQSGRHTLGMAYIGTVCRAKDGYSSSLVEENGGLSSAGTAVHELGHSLGAKHDGEDGNSVCPSVDNFIMAPGNTADKKVLKNVFRFSRCTIREFKILLSSADAACLFDTRPPQVNNRLVSTPGQVMSPDQQCQDVFGPTSERCDMSDLQTEDEVCVQLWCLKPGKAGSCVSRGQLSAVLGTTCGHGKVCTNGDCVQQHKLFTYLSSVVVQATDNDSYRQRLTDVNKAVIMPTNNHVNKPVHLPQKFARCRGDTNIDYCQRSVQHRPDLCLTRDDLAAYCCYSCIGILLNNSE
jgi:hypothetical protein